MLKHIDLFSGIGGFTKAAEIVGGIETTQFVEICPDAQYTLRSQYPNIPIHSDIRDFRIKEKVEILTAGFPCTNTSVAGDRSGITGEYSSLWFEVLRLTKESRPKFVVLENPTGLLSRGMGEIIKGLSESGYMGEWQTISAASLNAPHQRERLFIIAYAHGGIKNKKQPCCWSDQMRDLVQEQRAITKFPVFESANHGAVVRFPEGLDKVPVGVERGAHGRIRSRPLRKNRCPCLCSDRTQKSQIPQPIHSKLVIWLPSKMAEVKGGLWIDYILIQTGFM